MFWRSFIFAFLAVGAVAVKFEVLEANKHVVKHVLTTVCKKYGGGDFEDKAAALFKSVESFLSCASPLVDFNTLALEIEVANLTGTLDEVSKKYCAKLKTCLHTLIDASSPCVESAESELPLAKNRSDKYIDYVCYNEGSRITQFLTDNGPECIMSKGKEISEVTTCFRPQIDTPLEKLLSLTLTEKCRIFDRQNTCILKSLKTCNPPTLGYLLESLVAYVRKISACNDALPLPGTTGIRTTPTPTSVTSLLTTRTTSPTTTRTTSPTPTRTTSPTPTRSILPTFLLTLSMNVSIAFPQLNYLAAQINK